MIFLWMISSRGIPASARIVQAYGLGHMFASVPNIVAESRLGLDEPGAGFLRWGVPLRDA